MRDDYEEGLYEFSGGHRPEHFVILKIEDNWYLAGIGHPFKLKSDDPTTPTIHWSSIGKLLCPLKNLPDAHKKRRPIMTHNIRAKSESGDTVSIKVEMLAGIYGYRITDEKGKHYQYFNGTLSQLDNDYVKLKVTNEADNELLSKGSH